METLQKSKDKILTDAGYASIADEISQINMTKKDREVKIFETP